MSEQIAVLTGDLVGSSKLTTDELDRAREAIISAASDAWMPAYLDHDASLVIGKPEFFRGDSWQAALGAPTMALRASLMIRCYLRSLDAADTRISIGIGTAERLDRRRLSRSTGEAFELSGRGLDEMPAAARLVIRPGPVAAAAAPPRWLDAVASMLDALVAGLTSRQAEMLIEAMRLPAPTDQQIAQQLEDRVTRQSVQKTLAAAQWPAFAAALTAMEAGL